MAINLTDDAPRISYTVSTSTSTFQVPFEFFDAEDLVVVVGGTTKTLTTHYTVSQNTNKTGSITMTSGNAVSSGTVIIFRNIPFKRTTDFPTSGSFDMDTLNTELDRNIALFDDQQDRIDRAVRLNDNDDAASMVLPLKASRKGTVLGFNATTGAAEAGPTIANVNSLADITTNINTVAGIASNVTTVAGIDANVSTVAGISSNVSTVAGIQSNVSSVAGNATNINTVAGSIANVNTVATNIADVNAVAADLAETVSEIETVAADLQETQSEIDTVATNITNVNTVGNAITNVNTTATNISNINTLAGISSNVSTVAGINSDVTTVAGISSNVTTVANNETDIGEVALNIANVNTVGGISGNVTTVAGISGNVSTVAGISSNVSTVAGINTDVSTVAGISSNVTSVANDASDIGTVASAISNVNTVAGNTTNINTVAGNNSNISTVGGISSNVTTVAGIASNVTTVAGISSDVTTVANDATDIGTVSTNISNVNTLANALSGTNAYTVTVVNSGGNKFALNGATNPTLTLKRGITYTFDQSDNTNSGHPLAFKDGSGNAYTSGVTVTGTAGQAGAKVVFAVPSNAPSSLLYYCTVHGNAMGNSITVQDDNVAIVAGISSDITSVAGVASNVTTVAGIASNVSTVASNVSGINDFADRYRVASSAPSSNNDEGDLYYNTTSDQLFVYNGSAWISAALDASSALVPSNNLSDVASASTARSNLGLGTIATQSSVDSNIDTHLNTSTASNNEFLQWSGSDYQWSAVDLSAYLTSSTAASTYAPLSGANFSGTIVVGDTSSTFNDTTKTAIRASGDNYVIKPSVNIAFNRTGSDGDILEFFRTSSTKIGVVGAEGGYLKLVGGNGSVGSGLLLTNTVIAPRSASGASTNGTIDIGYNTERFKDLYLGGIGYSSTDFRAPIFYDSVSTSYYMDAAGTSVLNSVFTAGTLSVNTTSTLSSVGQIGIYSSSSPYISFHNGTTSRTAYFQEAGSRFYMGEVSYTETEGSFRAPIFYDVNNTSYYIDGASDSQLYRFVATGRIQGQTYIEALSYLSSPIMYDYNATSYYCDPSSTSNLNYVSVQTDLYLGRALNVNIGGGGASGGTSGQVLTSQGANATPQWQDPGGSNWSTLSSTTTTSTSSYTYSVSNNKFYRFIIYGLRPVANHGKMYMSFRTTSYPTSWAYGYYGHQWVGYNQTYSSANIFGGGWANYTWMSKYNSNINTAGPGVDGIGYLSTHDMSNSAQSYNGRAAWTFYASRDGGINGINQFTSSFELAQEPNNLHSIELWSSAGSGTQTFRYDRIIVQELVA